MNLTQYEHLTRQLNLIPVDKLNIPVHVIGTGAVGSFAALSLVKMGVENVTVWDMDTVSVENMSCQFFRKADIGYNKATALASLIHAFTGVVVATRTRAFTAEDGKDLTGIVVSGVDSMEVRKMIFKNVTHNVRHIIDPRMSAEFYCQYTIDPFSADDRVMYEKTLYTDEEAVQERCTAKSTVYTATLAAGMVVKTVKDIILGGKYPRNTQWDISGTSNPMLMFAGGVAVGQ